jgi:hypothetical protein
LNQNYNVLSQISQKINNEIGEDVLHFTIDKFLTKDHSFLDGLTDENKLKYVVKTIKLQTYSNQSQYYREVKKYSLLSKDVILVDIPDSETDTTIEELQLFFIEDQLRKMNWFSSLMFRSYVDTGYSAQKLADKLLIPLSTVQYHIRKVKTQIKTEWNKIDKSKLI